MEKLRFYLTTFGNFILFSPSFIYALALLYTLFTGYEYAAFGAFLFGIAYIGIFFVHFFTFVPTIFLLVFTSNKQIISNVFNVFLIISGLMNGAISVFAIWFSFGTYGGIFNSLMYVAIPASILITISIVVVNIVYMIQNKGK